MKRPIILSNKHYQDLYLIIQYGKNYVDSFEYDSCIFENGELIYEK